MRTGCAWCRSRSSRAEVSSGRLTAASSWPLSKATLTRLIARSLVRTASVCSPPQGTRPRGSGRLIVASSWPLSKATATEFGARSLAPMGGVCSPHRLATPADWIPCNQSPDVARHRLLAEVSEHCVPLRVARSRLFSPRPRSA